MPAEQRATLKDLEVRKVQADIEAMWATLAELYQSDDSDPVLADGTFDRRAAVDEIRHEIERRVEMRKRWVWYRNFQVNRTKASDAPRWQRWLAGGGDGPDIDSFAVIVEDEKQAHVVLRNIDLDTQNFLGKRMEQFPGLTLQASTHRRYPLEEVACHTLGRMARVSANDVADAKADGWDETRAYLPNDQIGRDGIESLCEPLLRGARGRIERRVGDAAIIKQEDFQPGQDVRLSVDADLQREVQQMLKRVTMKVQKVDQPLNMHAAAVVIDVPTGELRVMASNPDFNANDLDSRYAALLADRLDNPLKNRATMDEFEPGSTVKPMLGLGAITQGVLGPTEGIECTGYLILDYNGRKLRQSIGRCWVASEFAERLAQVNMSVAHHPIPIEYPHRGHDGNPDGWLSYSDAIERSCNVFFENVADRLGPAGIDHWYRAFGFGQRTGVGIPERPGRLPGSVAMIGAMNRMTNCFAGIGQSQVWATPLQIANEAATIARGGVWMRPRLITDETQVRLDAVRKRNNDGRPDRVDLHLSPEGLRQAKIGMVAVVNDPAGTGQTAYRDDMVIAAKTGSAEGTHLWLDSKGLVDQSGKPVREPLPPANDMTPKTGTEWYRSSDPEGKHFVHAWFMGFAPAEDPQIAFCVFIEYAGVGGGTAAGPVVSEILEACVKHGYLHVHPREMPFAVSQ
jgi:penicillin-binding protein 2